MRLYDLWGVTLVSVYALAPTFKGNLLALHVAAVTIFCALASLLATPTLTAHFTMMYFAMPILLSAGAALLMRTRGLAPSFIRDDDGGDVSNPSAPGSNNNPIRALWQKARKYVLTQAVLSGAAEIALAAIPTIFAAPVDRTSYYIVAGMSLAVSVAHAVLLMTWFRHRTGRTELLGPAMEGPSRARALADYPTLVRRQVGWAHLFILIWIARVFTVLRAIELPYWEVLYVRDIIVVLSYAPEFALAFKLLHLIRADHGVRYVHVSGEGPYPGDMDSILAHDAGAAEPFADTPGTYSI